MHLDVGAHERHYDRGQNSRKGSTMVAQNQDHLLTYAQKTDDNTARAIVYDAQKAGLVLHWCPGYAKKGISGERYQFYSKTKTFTQFDTLTKDHVLSGRMRTMKPRAVSTDLAFDAARGTLKFADADTPP